MRPLAQMLVGLAAAGVVAGPQRPFALVAGAVAGVLPDVLDWWERQLARPPRLTVTPDPRTPTPAIVAEGVRAALCEVRRRGCPCLVRFNPLPDGTAGYRAYQLDCDRAHRLVVAMASTGKPVPVDPPGAAANSAETFAALHPLPLRVVDTPRDLLLSISGRRIESRDLDLVAGMGHGLPVAAMLAATGFACGRWTGLAVVATLALHLLLDRGGRREWSPWAPWQTRPWPGRRLWDEQGWRANLLAALLATAVAVATGLAG